MSHQKKIIVIIVTYNGEACIDYCFGSLKKSTIPVDILCVDNDSSDNTIVRIKENYPDVEVVKNDKNLGFGRANNIGLKRCIDDGYNFAFLLNQDARIEPDTIEKLVSVQEKNREYGILSPVHRSESNNELDLKFSRYVGANWAPKLISDSFLSVERKDVYETKFVNAALWLISRGCLERVGYFDPIFQHYGEDSEYVFRMQKLGMKVGIVPTAYANHIRFKIKNTENTKNYNSILNRSYSRLLLNYKRSPLSGFRRLFYFIRKFLADLLYHGILFDFKLFGITIFTYMRLFYDLTVHWIFKSRHGC